MEKPEHHIFVCMSFRGLEPKGKCIKKNAGECWVIWNRNWRTAAWTTSWCQAPVVWNSAKKGRWSWSTRGYWYQGVDGEDAIDAILDALENGGPAKEYLVD